MRYTDSELAIIKNTFADNEEALMAIRKVFLQLPLDPIDKSFIDSIKDKKDLLAVLQKTFLPKLDGNAPIHQTIDLWMTIDLKDKTPDMLALEVKARGNLIDYLEQCLDVLAGKQKGGGIVFSSLTDFNKNPEQIYIDLLMRNTLIGHTEMQLNQLLVLAGRKEESVEGTKIRLAKDSAK